MHSKKLSTVSDLLVSWALSLSRLRCVSHIIWENISDHGFLFYSLRGLWGYLSHGFLVNLVLRLSPIDLIDLLSEDKVSTRNQFPTGQCCGSVWRKPIFSLTLSHLGMVECPTCETRIRRTRNRACEICRFAKDTKSRCGLLQSNWRFQPIKVKFLHSQTSIIKTFQLVQTLISSAVLFLGIPLTHNFLLSTEFITPIFLPGLISYLFRYLTAF